MASGIAGASGRSLFSSTQPARELPAASAGSFAAAGGEGPVQLKCLGQFMLKVRRSCRPPSIKHDKCPNDKWKNVSDTSNKSINNKLCERSAKPELHLLSRPVFSRLFRADCH